jgi:hypothetical protein
MTMLAVFFIVSIVARITGDITVESYNIQTKQFEYDFLKEIIFISIVSISAYSFYWTHKINKEIDK